MIFRPTARFAVDYNRLPQPLQQRVDKALFSIEADAYVLLRVGTHDLLK